MGDWPDHLDLEVGEEVTLELPGLGTAGYEWQEQLEGASDALTLSWSRGFEPGTEPRLVGRSAPERATIRAVAPGTATVRFVQARPWETNVAPLNERRLSVRVAPRASSEGQE